MENKRLTVGLFLADVADDFSRESAGRFQPV